MRPNFTSAFYTRLLLLSLFLPLGGSLFAQMNYTLTVYQVNTNIGDCDGFVAGDSDPIWWWGNDGAGCYTTTCNGCTRSITEQIWSDSYACIQDVPSNISIRFNACEDDGGGCAGNTSLAICDGSSGQRTDLYNLPTAAGSYNYGPYCVNSNCGTGGTQYCYWATLTVSGSFFSAPVNDNICNALNLPMNTTVAGNNTCGTVQAGEVNSSAGNISPSNTVWYKFVAPASGHVIVSTDFGGTTFDTEIAVYHDNGSVCPGNNWGGLTEVGNDDDIIVLINLNSELELECLKPGDTYYVQVDGNDASDYGGFQVRVSSTGPALPTNDDICNAINLGTLNFGSSVGGNNYNNFCGTTQPGEPNPSAFGIDQTMWFTFTTGATQGTEALFSATNDPLGQGDQIDLQIAVYTSSNGTCSGTFSEVDSDYFTPPFGEDLTIPCLAPNTTYFIQVDGSGLNVEGYFGLSVTDNGTSRATNDNACSPIPLSYTFNGTTTSATYNNFCATTQPGEPVPSFAIEQTVWFSFTTPATVGANTLIEGLNVGSDDIDLQLALYESSGGCSFAAMTLVDSDYDPLFFSEDLEIKCLKPNTTYYLQVDGWDAPLIDLVQGTFQIRITDDGNAAGSNNDMCNASPLGTIPNGGGYSLTNLNNYCADTEPGEPVPLLFNIDQTVWWTFKPPASGSVEIELLNSGSDDIDLQLAVWESSDNTCNGIFSEVESYDDPLSWSITGGKEMRLKCLDTSKTYFIQIDGWPEPITGWLVEGIFDMNISDYNVSAAPHDSICNAIALGDPTGGSVQALNQHNFCSNNILEPIPSAFGTNMTVWYSFIAPSTGRVVIDGVSDPLNTGDYIDIQLAVFAADGDSCSGALTEIESEYNDIDDPYGILGQGRSEEMIVHCLEPGRIYWLMVDGSDDPDDVDGFFDITITEQPGPPLITNDSICTATPLGAVPPGGSVGLPNEHNFCAGTEAGEPVPVAFGIDATVWYTFQAPPSGNVTINLVSDPMGLGGWDPAIELQVAVYGSSNGTCTGTLYEVDSDYDPLAPVTFDEDLTVTCLEPGETYWVQIDGSYFPIPPLDPEWMEGYFSITISEDPAFPMLPTNDSICDAVNFGVIPSGGSSPVTPGSNYCATTEAGEPNVDNCFWFFDVTCDETVWYAFTTNNNPGTTTIDITNTSGIDANITVYEATNMPTCSFADLVQIGSADNLLSFDVDMDLECLKANTTYYVQVDGGDLLGNYGTFDIQILDDGVPNPVQANDAICSAVALGTVPSGGNTPLYSGDNFCASEEPGEPNVSGSTIITDPLYDETVWFTFTTGGTPGLTTINITNVVGLVPGITVYQATNWPSCSFADLLEIDDATNIVVGNLLMDLPCLQPNTTYYIQLDGLDIVGDNGTFDIFVTDDGNPTAFAPYDDICNAYNFGTIPVGGNSMVSTHNFCATEETGEPNVSGGLVVGDPTYDETVWFYFTAPATPGLTTVSVTNTVGIDATMNIYHAPNGANCAFADLIEIESVDNLLSTDVAATLPCLTPGETYYIQIDGVDILGDQGSFDVTVTDDGSMNAYATNDSICNAIGLGVVPSGGGTAVLPSHNFCATEEPGEPNVSGSTFINSLNYDETVWYTFTTSGSPGTVTVNVFNTVGIDAQINVYAVTPQVSCNYGNLTFVRGASNLLNGDASVELVCLTPNTTYYVQVDGNDLLGNYGTFDIQVIDDGVPVAAPSYNLICNAVALGNPNGGQVGPFAANNNCADEEANEPGVNGNDETVWFTFIAPTNGQVEIDINSTAYIDANFTLYHSASGSCDFDSLTQIGNQHDDLLSFDVNYTETCLIPGETYYVQVDGFDLIGDYGDFEITIFDAGTAITTPANDPCANAVVLPIGNEPCQGTGLWNVFNYGTPTVSANGSYVQGCGDNCGDIWYTFTMPSNGTVLIEGNDEYGFLGTANSELTIVAYTGSCGNLSPVNCDQGGFFDDPQFYVTAPPGTQVFLQVFDEDGDDVNVDFGLCVTDRCGADSCQNATPMTPGIDYCFDTDGATGESSGDPGYEECGDGSDPGHSVYFSYVNTCPSFTVTVNADIGGACILNEPTDGLSISIYQDATPCDWNPDALLDCEQTDACLGANWYWQYTYANIPIGTQHIIQIDGFDFTGDNSGLIRIDEICPLPMTVLHFAGWNAGSVNELEWTVNEDAGNGYFIVERSTDGQQFQAIGNVDGNDFLQGGAQGGGSSASLDYAFTDQQPILGHNYYRLHHVDPNGDHSMSEVIDIYLDGTGALAILGLYPNPARTNVNVDVFVPEQGKYALSLTDLYGRVVWQAEMDWAGGVNHADINLENFAQGMYILNLRGPGKRKDQKRLVIQ